MDKRNQNESMQYTMPNTYGYMPSNPNMPGDYGYMQPNQSLPKKPRRVVTASMLLGILSALLLTFSVFVPALDLSAYHESVQIRYSILKICENVGLISDMWRGIPIGILIGAAGMLVLSFIRIPPLKAIPCMIVVSMIILALVDIGNVIDWITKMLATFVSAKVSSESVVTAATIWRSFQAGIYLLAAGLISGIVSCFVSNHPE